MKLLALAFLAFMFTLFVTLGAMWVCLWAYRHGYNPPINKELFFGAVATVFVAAYRFCWVKAS